MASPRPVIERIAYAGGARRFRAALATIARDFREASALGNDEFWAAVVRADSFTALLLHRDPRRRVDGFLLYSEVVAHGYTSWYVDVVCAREAGAGVGRALLGRLEEDARAAGAHAVTMHALPHVIPYYHRLGYRLARCSVGSREARAVAAAFAAVADRRFAREADAFADRKFAAFLRVAARHRLAHPGASDTRGITSTRDGIFMSKWL